MIPSFQALALAIIASFANVLGGALASIPRHPSPKALGYFMAFGGGFIIAAAVLEMFPESLERSALAPLYVILGYLAVHLSEHLFAHHGEAREGSTSAYVAPEGSPVRIRWGHPSLTWEQAAKEEEQPLVSTQVSLATTISFVVHTFLDGAAIAAGFLVSESLGVLLFFAVFFHKVPAGLAVAAVVRASLGGRRGRRTGFLSAISLGVSTLVGFLVTFFVGAANPALATVALALAAGSFIHIGASDLIPTTAPPRSRAVFLFVLLGVAIFYATTLFVD